MLFLIIGGIVLAALVALAIRVAYAFAPMSGRCRTGPLAEGLWAIRDKFVCGYLISDGKVAIAIDAGMDAANFAEQLDHLPVDPAMVQAIYLTHADGDHYRGASAYPQAALIIPAAEEAMVTGKLSRRMLGRDVPMRVAFQQAYSTIADGETRTHGGISIRAIHSPGHTPGSTCYLVNGTWLFTGDLLMLRHGRAEPTFRAINNDTLLSIKSLERLANGMDGLLDGVKLLVTAHTGATADLTGALEPFRTDAESAPKGRPDDRD